jgi:hypothetical protein
VGSQRVAREAKSVLHPVIEDLTIQYLAVLQQQRLASLYHLVWRENVDRKSRQQT